MMRLKMLKSFPWHSTAYAQGQEYDVDEKYGKAFVAMRLAEEIVTIKPGKRMPPKPAPVITPENTEASAKDKSAPEGAVKAMGVGEPYMTRAMAAEKPTAKSGK